MRYDDPTRPTSMGADSAPMQISGSPLPVITLVRPMESGGEEYARCTTLCIEANTPQELRGTLECPQCDRMRDARWGWLACIHAHREGSRFGYHTAWIGDIGEFTTAYLADPEAALARWFKYLGPEARKPIPREVAPDLWEV